MDEELNSIYNDVIMEYSMSTHNKRNIEDKTASEHGHNPSCGDDITLEIKLNGDVIEDLAYQGSGCAISTSSTSIMIDLFKGKTKKEALELIDIFLRMIKRENISDDELEKIEEAAALKNISNMPARVKCAELAWYTMKKLLDK